MSKLTDFMKKANPYMVPMAKRFRPFAVLHHVGRKSGAPRNTPVQAYATRDGNGIVVGLGYGYNSAWALNLLAAGGGRITRRGRVYDITHVRRAGPEALDEISPVAATLYKTMKLNDFIQFNITPMD